jgi:dihydroneopterin aldolase
MTLFLASVRDKAEAEILRNTRADIIDLKEPARGALGALDLDTTREIVSFIAGRVPASATIGDLPMQPDTISAAVLERAACGVDYVKFGLFPDGDARACLEALCPVAQRVRLIVVLFADRLPYFDAVARAAAMGAAGVMLDTAGKSAGSLLDHLDHREIANFITHAKAHRLMVGLAGSLTADDVLELLPLAPDLIGFRGALCHGSRSASLAPSACAGIRDLIPRDQLNAETRPSARMAGAAAQALC